MVGGDSITGESVAADATVRDAANRAVGGDSITGESVVADATVCEGAIVGSIAEAVAGNGAFWLDAKAEAVAGSGAFWEEDARRSPIMAFDLELESAPMGRGEQPTNPANNATSANSLPKPGPCDMASSAAVNTRFVAKLVAQIAFSSYSRTGCAGTPAHVTAACAFRGRRRTASIVAGARPPRQLPEIITG